MILYRRYFFQSVHSLKSHGETLHGHGYKLEIGFLPDLTWRQADECVRDNILKVLHGHEIQCINPATGENIVNWIHAELLKTKMGESLISVALQETAKNRFISQQTKAQYV